MYRSDTMDELPSPETPFRDDSLRELVDALPPLERHVIERCFFGGEPFSLVAKELNVDVKVAKAARAKALETLKEALQHDKPLRALRAATKRRV
jgi:DNA-directed RNA polymerase specialized sigma24 family protein